MELTPKQLHNFLKSKNSKASFIDKLKINYRPYNCPLDVMLKYINPSDRLFDIGCGSGQFALLVAEFVKLKEIKGIEISEELVKNAQDLLKDYKNAVKVEFSLYDGIIIPDDIKDFTKISMLDIFHHLPIEQRQGFIQQLYHKMNEGATFIFKDIDASHPLVIGNKLHDLVFSREISREISKKKMVELLKKTGFTIIEFKTKRLLWYPHFWVIATK